MPSKLSCKATLLTEAQVTVILEAMKARGGQGQSIAFQDNLEGIETAKSRAIRIGMLHRQIEAGDTFRNVIEGHNGLIYELHTPARLNKPNLTISEVRKSGCA